MDVLHPLTFAFPAMQYNVGGDGHDEFLWIDEKKCLTTERQKGGAWRCLRKKRKPRASEDAGGFHRTVALSFLSTPKCHAKGLVVVRYQRNRKSMNSGMP
jgi:hypothetical protein